MAEIHVDQEAIDTLKTALQEAGTEYKDNLVKLMNLMDDITRGDIQGDPATALLAKFEEKREVFNRITETIEEAEGYMGLKSTKFSQLISDNKSSMR